MKKFTEYFSEAMTNPYEHSLKIQDKHRFGYHFKDDKGKGYNVEIVHRSGKTAEVAFEDQDKRMQATGEAGAKSMRVFSTVKDVMKKHAEKHGIVGYRFSSIKAGIGHQKRERLYKALTKKHGGSYDDSGMFMNSYHIPVK